jgi:hypothetical protein
MRAAGTSHYEDTRRYDWDQILAWMQGMSWVRESSLWQIAVEEGREEGQPDHARRTVLGLGADRFGTPDVATRATIESIDDLGALDRLLHRILTATSWQALLETLPER